MANIDSPFGFAPVATLTGTDYKNVILTTYAPASYATALFVGSPVKIAGSASPDGLYPSVTLSAATEAIDYVVVGFRPKFDTESLDTPGGGASTERFILCVPAAYTIFEIQSAGSIAVTDVGSVADITAESGSTITGNSTVELLATYSTGSSAQCQILGLSLAEGRNDIASANPVIRVKINESNLAFASNGI